jgi:hypothetical protein
LLNFESNLVCAPCRYGKMIGASHSPVNTVMTKQPGQLLHMDIVDPSQVRSTSGKWYALVIIDDYSHYSWVSFLESKDEVFEHFQSLALRLNNEHPNCLKLFIVTMGPSSGMPFSISFALSVVLISNFCPACASTEWSCGTKEPQSS